MILSDPHAKSPVFVPLHPDTYVFELVVTDNTGVVSRPHTATFVVGNDPPEVQVVSPGTGMVGGQVAVQFTLADATADLANVQIEFSRDGGHTFQLATLIDEAPPVLIGRQTGTADAVSGPIMAEGKTHTFLWNTTEDLGTMSPVDVFIRVVLVDSESEAAGGPFTFHPLFDSVAQTCGLPSAEWDLSLAAWETLRTSLAQCQKDLATMVDGEIENLSLAISFERSAAKTDARAARDRPVVSGGGIADAPGRHQWRWAREVDDAGGDSPGLR